MVVDGLSFLYSHVELYMGTAATPEPLNQSTNRSIDPLTNLLDDESMPSFKRALLALYALQRRPEHQIVAGGGDSWQLNLPGFLPMSMWHLILVRPEVATVLVSLIHASLPSFNFSIQFILITP